VDKETLRVLIDRKDLYIKLTERALDRMPNDDVMINQLWRLQDERDKLQAELDATKTRRVAVKQASNPARSRRIKNKTAASARVGSKKKKPKKAI
jgi:hypothetical protein